MRNMSCCRFETTERDLEKCLNALDERRGVDPYYMPKTESAAMMRLIRICVEISENYGDLVE